MNVRIVNPDGSAEVITLDPSAPVFLGRDERCTVQLRDPSVHPVHVRLKYEGGAWVLDVATGAPPVLVNGQTTTSQVLYPGDEIVVGNTRLEFGYVPAADVPAAPVMQAGPAAAEMGPLVGVPPVAAEPKPRRTAPPPPSENLLKSPLIVGSAIALVVLLVLGIFLYRWYYGRTSEALFDQAQTAMQEGRSLYARKLFQRFLEEYPEHELANLALIYRELCDVQAAMNEGDLKRAQEEIQDLFDRTNKLPELQGVLDDIADTMVQVAMRAAEAAETTGERSDFELARQLRRMLDQYIPDDKEDPDTIDRLDKQLAAAEAAVIKQETYTSTVESMKQAIGAGDTETAYRARDKLVAIYPDLENDKQILELMAEAAKVDLNRCQWQPAELQAQRTDRTRASRYIVSLVAGPAGSPPRNVGYAVAQGAMYGLDGASGAPLWRRYVGFDAVRLPVEVPSSLGARVALLDTAHRELLLLDPLSGAVQWRLQFDEGLFASPLFHRGNLYLPTLAGNLYRIDAGTGRVYGRLNFGPQELAVTPVASRSGKYLYVLGEHSNLYIVQIEPDTLKPVSVFYTGHLEKTVLASPLRLDRYLVVCENRTPGECVVRVLLTGEDDQSVEDLRQDLTLPGWVLSTPASYGNLVYIATDRDTVHVFSAGAPEAKEGLKKVTEARPGSSSTAATQAYVLFLGEEDLLVVGSSIRHYRFSAERQILRPTDELADFQGIPLQAPVKVGPNRFLVVWQPDRQPEVRATLVQFEGGSFKKLWEDRLAPGYLAADVSRDDDRTLYLLTGTGMIFRINPDILSQDGDQFLTEPVAVLEYDPAELRRASRVVLDNGAVVYHPASDGSRLFVQDSVASPKVRMVRLAAAAQVPPVGFAGGIMVATEDGRLYLLDVNTGEELAQPFQPPLQSDQRHVWIGLAALDRGRALALDNLGRAFVLELRHQEQNGTAIRYLAAVAEATLPVPPAGHVAVLGGIGAFLDEDGRISILDMESLGVTNRVEVGHVRVGPSRVGNLLVVGTVNGAVLAISSDGQVRWKVQLPSPVVSRPTLIGETLVCVCEDASVRGIREADGEIVFERRVEEPLVGSAVEFGGKIACFGRDGTVHVLEQE